MSRRRDRSAADALQAALEAGHTSDADLAPMLGLAGVLRGNVATSESRRAATKERMLRAAGRAWTDPIPGAGSRDHNEATDPDVHIAEVMLGHGIVVRMADVETITPDRAAKIAESLTVTIRDEL